MTVTLTTKTIRRALAGVRDAAARAVRNRGRAHDDLGC